MYEGEAFVSGRLCEKGSDFLCPETTLFSLGNYNEQLRVLDFPVYVSGENDPTLTPLVPAN